MQVRKFEAPSMKEALELVKSELGPEAIILGARDLKSGVRGRHSSSVEITAAISELQLNKRKLAETKLPQALKAGFRNQTATKQKEFIDKVYDRRMEAAREAIQEERDTAVQRSMSQRPARSQSQQSVGPTKTRYIDIDAPIASQKAAPRAQAQPQSSPIASRPQVQAQPPARTAPQTNSAQSTGEIDILKREIENLQKFISEMAKTVKPTTNLHPGAELGISYDLTDAYQ
ncbi:MAG: hypothetical protein K2X47_00815, partial [Bdellovibrionales bacterium]|nr:hypothetical protein [Bdellovibrionales bacterium]